jgi:hypothetical protein
MTESKERKVLIAMPTLGMDPDPDRWLNLLFRVLNNVRREGFSHACFFPYRQLWWEANNQIWNVAFQHKFDYILRLDDDVCGDDDNAFSKLLQADKDVIGAAYCNRRFPYNVQALVKTKECNLVEIAKDGEKNDLCLQSVEGYGYQGQDVKQVDLIGFGMTLIKVAPFKYLERPMYKGAEVCADDSYFAQICVEQKIKQFVHFGVRLKHQHVTLDNAGHLFNADVTTLASKRGIENA